MSFANTGLLSELEKSTQWVSTFELIERIRTEEKKIQEETVRVAEIKEIEKEKLKIAKGMKKKDYSIKRIIDLTDLTREKIEKLKV